MPNPYNRIKDRVKELETRVYDLEGLQQSMQKEINELKDMLLGKPIPLPYLPNTELISSDD